MHLCAVARSTLAVVISFALLGLGCENTHIQPNGKHQVLMFDRGIGPLGEGLATDIILPRQETVVRGCAKVDPICDVKTFHYDFNGTALEADPDPGLRVVEAPLDDRGYRMRVACDAPPAGNVGEVRVRIIANGVVRYADAFDMECRRADGMLIGVRPESVDLLQPSPPRALVAVGAKILVVVSPWFIGPNGGEESLFGLGFTVDDADGAFTLEGAPLWGASLTLDALAPGGTGSVVHAGPSQEILPVEAVPDEAWTLGLTTRACSDPPPPGSTNTPGSVLVSAAGHTAAGDYVGVSRQGCDFTFTRVDGTVISRPGQHCFDRCLDTPGPGQLCVSLGGKMACVMVDAAGDSH